MQRASLVWLLGIPLRLLNNDRFRQPYAVLDFVIDDTVDSWRPILLYTCILSRRCIEYNHDGLILTNPQQIV